MKQLQPCLESSCSEADELIHAKAAFTQECHAAGVKVNFVEPTVHLDMVRRADGGSNSADSSHAGMAGMAGMGSGAGAESAAAAGTATPTVARPAKADASPSGARTSGARASGARVSASATSKGVKPASFTGAAVPREIAGSMFGFVAAVAAAAAI